MTAPAKSHAQKAVEKILLLIVGANRNALEAVVVTGPNPGIVIGLRTQTSFVPLARILGKPEIDAIIPHFDHPLTFNQEVVKGLASDLAAIKDLDAAVHFLDAVEARLDVDNINLGSLFRGGH